MLGARNELLILSTLPARILELLVDEEHFLQSLTFQWAMNNVGIASWSMSAEEAGVGPDFVVTPASLEFFEMAGIRAGATIGFSSDKLRGKAVIFLVAGPDVSQDQIDKILLETSEQVYVAASVTHRCLSSLPFNLPGRNLTLRQREVLEWVAEGKTIADVALIMGITAPTVEKHLRLARETLGVETTSHALIKAIFLNQIFCGSPPGMPVDPPFANKWRLIGASVSPR